MAISLEQIHQLLSHLQGEVSLLEKGYTQVLSALERFEGAVTTDDLTGLLRRNSFFARWRRLLDECAALQQHCGILVIDIDHFKAVNDTHGHPTGDEVIRGVAALLKKYAGPACVAGRLGGEEFALAVRGTDAEILGIAEFVRRGAERLHGPVLDAQGQPKSNVEWKCTLSVGVASSSKLGGDQSRLMKAADEALYEAKKRGRNQVRAA